MLHTGSDSIESFSPTGDKVKWYFRAGTPDSLSRSDLRSFYNRQVSLTPGFEKEMPSNLGYEELPIGLPQYGWAGYTQVNIIAGSSDGVVWLLRFGGVRNNIPTWDVFDSSSTFRVSVQGPNRTQLLAVNESTSVFKTTGIDGVEIVFIAPLGSALQRSE